eukprot:TRINITY_DN7010_c0_g1_i1.p1 TRINITY_DN7010_c0_g1~~TRINITY_DN7010_c0_g1_i1.p1  ORF type:complete len:236 (+),score=40.74 TRINITY_DN7010_c0_g1_i1:1-708(+)
MQESRPGDLCQQQPTSMATVTCGCGSVEIAFSTPTAAYHIECCCHDCNAAQWYAETKKGGPGLGQQHSCIDCVYYPNDFTVTKGLDKIGSFLNFKGADTLRFVCKDCWTIVLADHPFYGTKIVLTQRLAGLAGHELPPHACRIFQADLNEEQRAEIPAWTGAPELAYDGMASVIGEDFPAIFAKIEAGTTMNAQLLAEQVGPPFIPEDEQDRMANGPPTIKQRMEAAAQAEEAAK